MLKKTFITTLTAVISLSASVAAVAAGDHQGGHHGASIGEPGKAAMVDRTVDITMHDNYYEPEKLMIEEGKTIRFKVSNEGSLVHEFNIGTAAMHRAHRDEMMTMMEKGIIEGGEFHRNKMGMGSHGMKHDDPNSVLLEPGKTRKIIWHFTKDTSLEFACNVPGHYQSGMHGTIHIQ